MEIADLVEAIAARGCRLNNLFQRQDGEWQANVCRDGTCFEYGKGPTMRAALSDALSKVSEMPKPADGEIFG